MQDKVNSSNRRLKVSARKGHLCLTCSETIPSSVMLPAAIWLFCHFTVASWGRPKFIDFIGVFGIIHGPLQTVRFHNYNQDHPNSLGTKDFDIPIDEIFGAKIINENVISQFETTGLSDKRHDIAGWCLDQVNGRVVGLTMGHTYFAYQVPIYLKLIWRSAHWAKKRDIRV